MAFEIKQKNGRKVKPLPSLSRPEGLVVPPGAHSPSPLRSAQQAHPPLPLLSLTNILGPRVSVSILFFFETQPSITRSGETRSWFPRDFSLPRVSEPYKTPKSTPQHPFASKLRNQALGRRVLLSWISARPTLFSTAASTFYFSSVQIEWLGEFVVRFSSARCLTFFS